MNERTNERPNLVASPLSTGGISNRHDRGGVAGLSRAGLLVGGVSFQRLHRLSRHTGKFIGNRENMAMYYYNVVIKVL